MRVQFGALVIAAVLLFVFGAARAVQVSNLHPFLPNGWPGVLSGAAIVFNGRANGYAVSFIAEVCKRRQYVELKFAGRIGEVALPELGASGALVVNERQLSDQVFAAMRAELAGSEVERPVSDVERPRVRVEFVREHGDARL